MKRIPVNSSNIGSIGYDAKKQILEIEFKGKGNSPASVYQYEGVPEALHQALMSSDTTSKGQFFDLHIKKGGFRFTKMPTGKAKRVPSTPKPGGRKSGKSPTTEPT